jgi:hypothetical protein
LLLAAAALVVGLPLGAEAAVTSVTVPRHDSPTISLQLLGATAEAVAVQNGSDIYSGAPGAALTNRGPLLVGSNSRFRFPLGVVGHTFAWWEEIARTSTTPERYLLHRTDLLDGSVSALEVPARPVAYTGDGWLSYSKDFAGGDLLRNLFDGPTTTLVRDTTAGVYPGVDGALLVSYVPASQGIGRYRLDLVSYGTGTVETLVDSDQFIASADLSAQTVAWATRPQGAISPTVLHQRARAGGAVSSYSDPSSWLHDATVHAGDGRAAYLVPDPSDPVLRVVTGAVAHDVPLPGVGTGPAVVGDRFVTAIGGPAAAAGLYSIDGDTVTRIGTVPASPIGVWAIAFSAGQLYYADEARIDQPGLSVWQRSVTGSPAPVLGPESLLPHRAALLEDAPTESISFSAGRSSVSDPNPAVSRYQFLDRGVITGTAKQTPYDFEDDRTEHHPNVSGPYTLAEGKVFAPDGRLLYTLPGQGSIQASQDDIYGSTVIWSVTKDFKTTQVAVRDIAKPKSATNPLVLANPKCKSGCPQLVSIWGNRVAWQSDPTHLAIRVLGSSKIRTVATGSIEQLELGENTLAWRVSGAGSTRVLDLTSRVSTPVTLAGVGGRIALDGHFLAGTTSSLGSVVVHRVPFTAKQPARMIGFRAASSFSPDGDGQADRWVPQFDASKPLTSVALKITAIKSGKTFRTLTGTGPDGSIRDLSWDGRTTGGKVLPGGSYRWTLTARAKDGEGSLISAGGKTTVTGTVSITGTT